MSFVNYEFKLPKLQECNYGRDWPDGTNQIIKELAGFKANGREKGYRNRYFHGLNLIRLLWPDQVSLYKVWQHHETGEKTVIWNSYFIRIFMACCDNKRVGLTGCSSSGKTFAVAVYAILLFMSDPKNTTIMVSTTAGSDAERRVWGEIKELHNAIQPQYKIGELIDYQKVITFNPSKEIRGERGVAERDIGSGIILIAIPDGQEGQKALGKIIGTKQKTGSVVWIIDELPNMIQDVLRAETNLKSVVWFQLIGIGNANVQSDPHGQLCEPALGWSSVNENTDEWEGIAGTKVVFCHGERSPNHHPAVDQTVMDREKYPFPYLSNPVFVYDAALLNGRGNVELGRTTMDFVRFVVGFWVTSSVPNVIVSKELVIQNDAHSEHVPWNWELKVNVAGFDPGWTSGGDYCDLSYGSVGRTTSGKKVVKVCGETIRFSSTVKGSGVGANEEFRKDIAKQVVAFCRENQIEPRRFGMDISGDGGMMLKALIQEWKSSEIVGLSSLEASTNPRYATRVTQFWMQVADAISAKSVKGFNLASRYFKDFSRRTYKSSGKGKDGRGSVAVAKKADFKKSFGHSPDAGDSFSYMMHMAIAEGVETEWHLDHEKNRPRQEEPDGDGEQGFNPYEYSTGSDFYG